MTDALHLATSSASAGRQRPPDDEGDGRHDLRALDWPVLVAAVSRWDRGVRDGPDKWIASPSSGASFIPGVLLIFRAGPQLGDLECPFFIFVSANLLTPVLWHLQPRAPLKRYLSSIRIQFARRWRYVAD